MTAPGRRPSDRDAGTESAGPGDGTLSAPHVVLALDPGGLQRLLGASPEVHATDPVLAAQAAALQVAPPFAVTRLWLDRDVAADRAPFNAVSG